MYFSLYPFIFSLLPLFLFLVFLLKWLSITARPLRKNPPPSPRKLPLIGNLHQMGPFPHRSLHSLSQVHGPLMLLHFASSPVLVVSSTSAAREIMKTHDLIFSNRPKLTLWEKLMYGAKDVAFSPYGEYWRQMKSIFVLQLLSNKRVQSFRGVREEETALMIEKISGSCSDVVNLTKLIGELTGNVVCRVAFGWKYGGGEGGGGGGGGGGGRRGFIELMREFVELLGVFDIGDFAPWLKWVNRVNGVYGRAERLAKDLDEFLEGVIKEHEGRERKGGKERGQDLVDVLLEIHRENVVGISVHRDGIKALILDVFAAGTQSTSTALEWAMTELLKHPQAMKKLQAEVRKTAQSNQPITEDNLDQIPYLKAVIKETLRLHPPIPLNVPRESTKDVQVMGYDVAAGTRVVVNSWGIGQDPASWDEPEEFRPERFLNSCSVNFRGQDFELVPFGAGRRGCPGIEFAVAVNELAVANLVHKFDFVLPDGVELDVNEVAGLTVRKNLPLLLVATPWSC